MLSMGAIDEINLLTMPTTEKMLKLKVLEKRIKTKYADINFCHTNGSKMNYRLYDSKKETKTFNFANKEFEKVKPSLLKKTHTRFLRCKQVQNSVTRKKEMFSYSSSSASINNTLYSINKEQSLMVNKYRKLIKQDDEISLVPSVYSEKIVENSLKNGSYFNEFVDFCFFKKQLLDKIDKQLIDSLKKKSNFTKYFLEMDINTIANKFQITQVQLIEFKLLIDYLEKELQTELIKDHFINHMFRRLKSSFILFSVTFYKSTVKSLPSGITSYYSNVKGNFNLFTKIVDNMLLFKRFFDMGSFYISIDDFLENIKTFGCEIDIILDLYENFDDLLEVEIKTQKYEDYRIYFITKLKKITNEVRKDMEKYDLDEHNYAVALIVKTFLEDYTTI